MASKVSAEGLSVVHKGSGGSVSFTPDVCLTPRPSDPPIPIPYTNSAVSQDADLGSQTVSCEGHPVLVEGSVFAKSTGDEPGSVGGVSSGVIRGAAVFICGSFNVMVEGKGIARFTDPMLGNKGASVNTAPSPEQQPPAPLAQAAQASSQDEQPQKVELRSTVAYDELCELARAMEEVEFLSWLTIRFGDEIPEEAYRALRSALLDGSLPQPEIRVVAGGIRGHAAAYNRRWQRILVALELAERARDEGGEAAWELFCALLEEFGHHVDHLLRNQYSSVAGDARLDEGTRLAYALVNLGWGEAERFAFATLTTDAGEATLEVEFSGLRKAIEEFLSEEEEADDAQEGELEFFGPGLGSGKEWSYGHEKIEDRLAAANFLRDDRHLVYFGNWLRDFSQVVDPKFVRKKGSTGSGSGAGKTGYPWYQTYKPSREALTQIIDVLARATFGDQPDFRVTADKLGVYRNEEHIDNPTGSVDGRVIDPDFRGPCQLGDEEVRVDPVTHMKRYIRTALPGGASAAPRAHRVQDGESLESIARANGLSWQELARFNFGTDVPERVSDALRHKVGCTHRTSDGRNYIFTARDMPGIIQVPGGAATAVVEPKFTTLRYLQDQLRVAVAAGREPEGYRHLGQALHTLEDFYAHTNFIEVALVHLGYQVEPWVPLPRTGGRVDSRTLPITSGTFAALDTGASITLGTSERLMKVHTCEAGVPATSTQIALILLEDMGWKKTHDWLGGLSGAINELENRYPKLATLSCATIGAVIAVFQYAVGGMVRAAANQIDDAQSAFLTDRTSTDPTHTQLAKDHDDHPLHSLAAELAGEASLEVGMAIQKVWDAKASTEEVLSVAGRYLIHPVHISAAAGNAWVMEKIRSWAATAEGKTAIAAIGDRGWAARWTKKQSEELAERKKRAAAQEKDSTTTLKRLEQLRTGGK